jgi:CHAT domain-containing protein
VTGQRFGDILSRLEVPLVILEACRTSDLSDRPVFGSVAPALLESGVGTVVAYSHSIHIEASRLLVESFYRELADGMTVGQALSEARTQMRAEPQRWLALGPNPPTVKLQDWFVPQLYQVGPDLSLIAGDGDRDKDAASAAEAVLVSSWEDRLHGFPPEPAYGFQGRALELLPARRPAGTAGVGGDVPAVGRGRRDAGGAAGFAGSVAEDPRGVGGVVGVALTPSLSHPLPPHRERASPPVPRG